MGPSLSKTTTSPQTLSADEEAFRNSLLSDVFVDQSTLNDDNSTTEQLAPGSGGSPSPPPPPKAPVSLDMEKVTMIIWKFRDSPDMINFISSFLAKFSYEKLVFDGIEFYLPQLAHMIIHLEVDWPASTLEQFALIISQHSLHFALQFNWILVCALQDYQPETAQGQPNPQYNEVFFTRCIKLLQNMERCVVYGTPRATELLRLYDAGLISRQEFDQMELADRRFNAFQIVDVSANKSDRGSGRDAKGSGGGGGGGGARSSDLTDMATEDNSGWLMYKRGRRMKYRVKPWKKRFFIVSDRFLFCFDKIGGKLRRAMPLEGCMVEDISSRHKNVFMAQNQSYQFLLRASSEEEHKKWVSRLNNAAVTAALFSMGSFAPNGGNSAFGSSTAAAASSDNSTITSPSPSTPNSQSLVAHLSVTQRRRYQFFKGERDFVRSLTDIAEELRFEPRPARKELAKVLIAESPVPPCAYVPLCKSTDEWTRVVAALPLECRVFSTKARCPVLMCFQVEAVRYEDGDKKDVVEFLHDEFGVGLEREEQRKKTDALAASAEDEDDDDDEDDDGLEESDEEETVDEAASGGGAASASSPTNSANVGGGDADPSVAPAPESPRRASKASNRRTSSRKKTAQPSSPFEKFFASVNPVIAMRRAAEQFTNSIKDSKLGKKKGRKGRSDSLSPKGKKSLWQDETPDGNSQSTNIAVDDDDEDAGAASSGGDKKAKKRVRVNQRVQNFLKDSHFSMPPSIATLYKSKGPNVNSRTLLKKKLADLPDKKINISNHRSDSLKISDEGIAKAKKIVCGGENWTDRCERLKKDHANEPGSSGEFMAVISKSNDDVRQEVFVMQLIHFYQSVFKNEGLPIFLKPYRILSTSKTTGLIELLKDATSIDGLKKSPGYPTARGLRGYFEDVYGPPSGADFKAAQENFMRSLVGYSLVSYLLGLKDRHNGNIMIDTSGRLIFIDFGFAMGMAPGHEWSMERAPFKLTKEYVEVLDGPKSEKFEEFKKLFVEGFKAARASSKIALGLVEIMMFSSNYPCFTGHRYGNGISLTRFQRRLMLTVPDDRVEQRARKLVTDSYDHWGTVYYDKFQLLTNGIAP